MDYFEAGFKYGKLYIYISKVHDAKIWESAVVTVMAELLFFFSGERLAQMRSHYVKMVPKTPTFSKKILFF